MQLFAGDWVPCKRWRFGSQQLEEQGQGEKGKQDAEADHGGGELWRESGHDRQGPGGNHGRHT